MSLTELSSLYHARVPLRTRGTVKDLEEFRGRRVLLLIWGSGKASESVSQCGLEG